MSTNKAIDLTQNSSDSDDLVPPSGSTAQQQNAPQLPSTPAFLTNHQRLFDDPLNAPLINTSHSIAYALSNSVIDPFSNLIRHLHQTNESEKAIFFQLTQNLATNAPAVSFIPILLQILENSENTVCSVLALQSLRVLSINNPSFCRKVLKHLQPILRKFQDSFLIEVLQLFLAICQYANPEQANTILSAIVPKMGQGPLDITMKEQFYAVFSVLSKYGDYFTEKLVEQIIKQLNLPGKPPLDTGIVWPCLVCVDNFLAQPSTSAYQTLQKHTDTLLGKLAHAAICVEKNNDPDLFSMILKLFLETIDEFKMEKITDTLNEFHLQLVASLINVKNSGNSGLSQLAETILKRLGLLQESA